MSALLTPQLYLDSCATTPPAPEVLEAMAAVYGGAWANPSSLHGFGLAAGERLERSRQRIAEILGCTANQVIFTSGGTESIHLALLGVAADGPPGRLVISSVEHPATVAAAAQLQRGDGRWSAAVLTTWEWSTLRPWSPFSNHRHGCCR